jgi:hypothetical protein
LAAEDFIDRLALVALEGLLQRYERLPLRFDKTAPAKSILVALVIAAIDCDSRDGMWMFDEMRPRPAEIGLSQRTTIGGDQGVSLHE